MLVFRNGDVLTIYILQTFCCYCARVYVDEFETAVAPGNTDPALGNVGGPAIDRV